MGTALLALCCCALMLFLALFVGISPISDKAKIRFMNVGAALSLMAVPSATMAYASSAFFKIGKKRKDIVRFLSPVFEAYFPGGEGFVYKKMPGTKS